MTNSPRERFWALRWPGPGDKRALDEFADIADLWRNQGYYLGAAAAMESAAMAAWGDPEQMRSCVGAAMEDYDRCLQERDLCSLVGFTALKKSAQLRWAPYGLFLESAALRQDADETLQVLADRLVACGEGSEHAESYLVRGLIVETDFEEHCVASYPDYDVDWDVETAGSGLAQIRIPSALRSTHPWCQSKRYRPLVPGSACTASQMALNPQQQRESAPYSYVDLSGGAACVTIPTSCGIYSRSRPVVGGRRA